MNNKTFYSGIKERAERIFSGREKITESSGPEITRLLRDLEAYHEGLEIQNEDLRRAQKELEISRNNYLILFDSAPMAYVTLNKKGVITRVNNKALELFDPEMLSKSLSMSSFIHRDDWDKFYRICSRGPLNSGEVRVLGKEGRVVQALMQSYFVTNRTEGYGDWFLTFTDISAQKQAEEETARHNRLLSGINRILEAVVMSEQELGFLETCLSVVEEITESDISFIGEIGPDGLFHDIAVSFRGYQACSMYDPEGLRNPPGNFHIHGIYGSVLKTGKSLISNDPASHPDRIGLPEGHPPLVSFMGIPLKQGENTTGMIGAGNRKGGYGSREQEALERLAPFIGEALARRRSEAALSESEERLKIATEGAGLGIWDRDLTAGKLVCNSKLYEFLGKNPDNPFRSEKEWLEYIHKDDLERLLKNTRDTIRTGTDFHHEFRIIREDGEIRWLATSARVYRDENGQPVRLAGVNYDITERKNLDLELKKYREKLEIMVQERTAELLALNKDLKKEIEQREKFEEDLRLNGEKILEEQKRRKYLSGKLVEMLEKERKEMAHTLHDEVGQALVTIKTDLDFLKERDGCHSEARMELEGIQGRIRDMMEYFSGLSHGLTPHIIRDLGLVPAVESLFENIRERSDLKVNFYTRGIPEHLSDDKDLAVYRIVQEGITNCLKYADAKNLFINMTIKDKSFLLTIEDDGIGFDLDILSIRKDGREKLGLSIMKERTVQAGGEFYIESQAGEGTQIIVEIPMGELK